MTRQVLPLLLSLAVMASACSGDDDGSPTPDPTPTPTEEDRLTTIARDIYDRQFALLNEPDPAHLDDLYNPDCDCYDQRKGALEAYAGEGWHVEGTPSEVLRVIDEDGSESAPRMTVQLRLDQRVVDRNGQDVENFPDLPTTPRCEIVGLEQLDDERYRITEQFDAGCPAGWLPIDGPDEWTEVVADLYERRYEFLHEPDPERSDELYSPDCECYDGHVDAARELADGGLRLDGRNLRPLDVTVESGPDADDSVRLRVQVASDDGRLVGPDGSVSEEYRGNPDERDCWATYGLEKTEDGSYRIIEEPPLECVGAGG